MPATKRKISANYMSIPVNVEQRVWNGSAYVWQLVQSDMFCEFQSTATENVGVGIATLGAIKHKIYTRYQDTIVPGMRLQVYPFGSTLYITHVVNVELLEQWLEITAYQVAMDTLINIRRPANPHGRFGQPNANDTFIATVLSLWAEPSASALAAQGDRVGNTEFWGVAVPPETDVAPGDSISIFDTGETYRVHSVRSPMSFKPVLALLVGKTR